MSKIIPFVIRDTKEMKLNDELFVRISIIERGLACLFLIDNYGDIVHIPKGFFLKDITSPNCIIDKDVLLETQTFALLLSNNYEFGYKDKKIKIINRQEWEVHGTDGCESV